MNPAMVGFTCILLFAQAPAEAQLAYSDSPNLAARTDGVVKDDLRPSANARNTAGTLYKKMTELEHSAAFRKAAADAWHATQNGDAAFETGFAVEQEGRPGKLKSSIFAPDENVRRLRLVISSTSIATFHIHNKFGDPKPSPRDIEIAKTAHIIVYVTSRDGLYSVDPDGNVRHVFSSPTWFNKK